jgi:hypothetical protein
MDTEQTQVSEAKITDHMVNSVRSTKPWTRFLSILGFIAVAFMLVFGILMMVVKNILPQANGDFPVVLMGLMYILMSLFYLFPSMYLFKYSSAVDRFLLSGRESEMESALSYQKSFWKFVGILSLIMIIIAILGIIAAIIIPLILGIHH